MKPGIYYRGTYLRLPDEFPTYEAFHKDLLSRPSPTQYRMQVLCEDYHISSRGAEQGRSMAPYFLSGYFDEASTVTIQDPADVYPVSVEILDQDSYNARLRSLICEKCPGCYRFKPLTDKPQSLNGHFEEMSLDGVCLFRQDSRITPRRLRGLLFSFGGLFHATRAAEYTAQQMQERIASWLYLRCDGASLEDVDGSRSLTLTPKKKELLAPFIIRALGIYLEKVTRGRYRIQADTPFVYDDSILCAFLEPKKVEAFRKECKRYGAAIGVLEYAPEMAPKVRESLQPLIDQFYLFPLAQADGKDTYLVTDTSFVLKELRYRAPLLERCEAVFRLHDQFRSARYRVRFQMEAQEI